MIGRKGYFGKNCDTQTLPCPTNDSKYALVDNKCVYFEKTTLTYDKAIENCKEKLKDYGGGGILYEPNSIAEQKRIVDMAYERGLLCWAWIGVTDKTTEGQFTYNSNNQPINFTLEELIKRPSRGRRDNCIQIFVHSGNSTWSEETCTSPYSSSCWSIT